MRKVKDFREDNSEESPLFTSQPLTPSHTVTHPVPTSVSGVWVRTGRTVTQDLMVIHSQTFPYQLLSLASFIFIHILWIIGVT